MSQSIYEQCAIQAGAYVPKVSQQLAKSMMAEEWLFGLQSSTQPTPSAPGSRPYSMDIEGALAKYIMWYPCYTQSLCARYTHIIYLIFSFLTFFFLN